MFLHAGVRYVLRRAVCGVPAALLVARHIVDTALDSAAGSGYAAFDGAARGGHAALDSAAERAACAAHAAVHASGSVVMVRADV